MEPFTSQRSELLIVERRSLTWSGPDQSCFSACGCFFVVCPGSEVVDWLHRNVEGFVDRREARKYAGNLLKAGYIRHTVNKVTFSEQCYYVFGDLCGGEDNDCRRRSLRSD